MGQLLSRCFGSPSAAQSATTNNATSSKRPVNVPPPKTYSWHSKPALAREQYAIENVSGETIVRDSSTLNGQQFVVKSVRDANIQLLGRMSCVSVDLCSDTFLIVGPTSGSVFLRNCAECIVLVVSQQLRLRDCRDMTLLVLCATQPIIEASESIRFGCLQLTFDRMQALMSDAGLSPFNNSWHDIYDFTPSSLDERNWRLIDGRESKWYGPALSAAADGPPPDSDAVGDSVSCNRNHSVIPYTFGIDDGAPGADCLVLFFFHKTSVNDARCFCAAITQADDVRIARCKQLTLTTADAHRILGSNACDAAVELGPVICIHICSHRDPHEACQSMLQPTYGSNVRISESPAAARAEIAQLFNFADMNVM